MITGKETLTLNKPPTACMRLSYLYSPFVCTPACLNPLCFLEATLCHVYGKAMHLIAGIFVIPIVCCCPDSCCPPESGNMKGVGFYRSNVLYMPEGYELETRTYELVKGVEMGDPEFEGLARYCHVCGERFLCYEAKGCYSGCALDCCGFIPYADLKRRDREKDPLFDRSPPESLSMEESGTPE
jgi:hypothetical protein